MINTNYFEYENDVKAFFRGYGSFGEIHGEVKKEEQRIWQETKEYRITAVYEKDACGVISRKDTFENVSDASIRVNCLKSRFVFEGGEYQVYSQFNTWQNESTGSWQPLVTSVSVSGGSTRLTQDAAPFMVLWSEQENRGVAFHLVPGSAWEMKITRVGHECKYTKVVVELGILSYNMDVELKPGETLSMPHIICYEVKNKLDMDCYKLHQFMHRHYPRKTVALIYNTWMYRFTRINFDLLSKQAELAADLGLEYFVIDAGWFGDGRVWAQCVGDWDENTQGAMCGRMREFADKVRSLGMKFGIWLEPERAMPDTKAVKEHREYYIDGDVENHCCFFDFSNAKAREWMLQKLSKVIDHYGVEYIKDDYNADMYFDIHHTAFLNYHEGHRKFMDALRERYPNLYITNCGSGGERMELSTYMKFDSAWPSDNESPYVNMRIYRDTLLRLPPQGFERWVCIHSLDAYKGFYESFGKDSERIVACGDAIWHNISGIQRSFLKGYMTGGPVGFSCDLSLISEETRSELKTYISRLKAEREFWKTAVGRILCATKTVTSYQYSDMESSRVVLQVFTHQPMQTHFRVYPVVDAAKTYRDEDGNRYTGTQLMEEGYEFFTGRWQDNWHDLLQITLIAE